MTPSVQVLLPVRDDLMRLSMALESLRAQDFDDWSCLVIDDGSVEPVAPTIARLGDPRFEALRLDGVGLTRALQSGLTRVRAPYVARLDADDECLPGRLSRQFDALERAPGVVAIGCGVELRTRNGRALGARLFPMDHDGVAAELAALLTPIPHSTLMARRSALEAIGGYRAAFSKAQDYDLLLRLSERGRLASLPQALVRLTVSPGSVTASAEGGEQFEYCVLGYACAILRRETGADPLEGAGTEEFQAAFRRWYAGSRLPAAFRSRLARREARAAAADGRGVDALSALARATWHDPAWAWRRMTGGGDLAAEARAWALEWARRTR